MTVMPLGITPLVGGVFEEHLLSPHHGLISLGENLDPRLVEQCRHFYVVPFLRRRAVGSKSLFSKRKTMNNIIIARYN
jgi:hypothetical protein